MRKVATNISDWNVDHIVKEIENNLHNVESVDEFEDFMMDDHVEIIVDFLVDSHAGLYMPEEAARIFDIQLTKEDVEYDYGWEAIEEAAGEVAEALTDAINAKGLPGHLFFGTTEGAGDYALIWIADEDDLEDYLEPPH